MSFSLAGLHVDILMQILKKIPWRSLVTIRQTCSRLNSLVEKHRQQLAKNTNEDICLEVEIDFNKKGEFELSYRIEIGNRYIYLHDPVRNLSAIQISEVHVSFFDGTIDDLEQKENETSLIDELLEVLQKLSLSPEDEFVKAKSVEEKKTVISNLIHYEIVDDDD